jgi:hypothetical protein
MWLPQNPAMTAGLPMDRAGLGIDAGRLGVVGAGEDAVMVAGQDHVDAVDRGQRDEAFSIMSCDRPRRCRNGLSAMMISAPSSRICGT